MIAKFSSTTDTFPVVQGEYVSMELARRAGLNAAPVELGRAAGRYALLVERFDREPDGARRHVVTSLTILGLTALPEGRYATYADLVHRIRAQFVSADDALLELFRRVFFNVLVATPTTTGGTMPRSFGPLDCN